MRKVFTILASTMIATTAMAEDTVTEVTAPATGVVVTGQIETVIAETATTDKYGATTSFDLGVSAAGVAFGGLDFVTDADNDLSLDEWHMGVNLGVATLSYGDQGNNWIGAEGEQTIADPAMGESLKVSVGDATVALGFTDTSADITDVANVQATYSINALELATVTGAIDYNMDSETTILGAGVGGVDLGVATASGAFTYDLDAETWGYEGVVASNGLTAYINGDDTEALQNIGGGYDYNLAGGLTLGGDVSYNVNDEEFTPSITAAFAF
jgi:hypothetical protein